jgi:hypothetical protein
MVARRGNLQPAHRGYRYQDIASAYFLVQSIVERYDEVIVDRKQVADDRIDDLEVRMAGRRVRRQFKSSQQATRPLSSDDFIGVKSSLRIDRLVLTHVGAGTSPADEYRLCATWIPPVADDPLAELLEPQIIEPSLAGWHSRGFRLRASVIWPVGSSPLWSPLPQSPHVSRFTRADFLEFCERFTIELELPIASSQLIEPGPLECALLDALTDGVGIGRYPNQGRSPADVAALAISLANLARTQEASLTPGDIERDLEIRVDFGRVAQSFPLDKSLFHDRPMFRQNVSELAMAGQHQLIIGVPGSGKSWELTRLADDLREAGAIVARHYCYLEPGDEMVEQRVTTDVFFGNILAELIDADPALSGAGGARFAAGIGELEATLAKATSTGQPVILVIDGLDHIARVRSQARRLSDDETDIVERLATVNIPPGVALVVGSQPGDHLTPLCERWGDQLTARNLPRWSLSDLEAIAVLHGLSLALVAVGIASQVDIDAIHALLAERADGNPLYARYLACGLVAGLKDGSIASPTDWITDAPTINGDVAAYYAHLYGHANQQAKAIADLIGVIDFSVSEKDLREIVGALVGEWVPQALIQLAPILTIATGQGGVRIFHESFRRFMTQELARQGRSVAAVLEPVIAWLEQRGLLGDAKAYRFLLPALRRAGRGDEVLQHVGVTFVSDSVAQAHRLDAIQRNLALAADIAAERRDWPTLVRCAELHRSAYSCFEHSQTDWTEYWAAYLEIFGHAALMERLLFDGRPTLGYSDGLYACALIDDRGGIAPWREYIDLYHAEHDSSEGSQDNFDRNGALDSNENLVLLVMHGLVRLGKRRHVFKWFLRFIQRAGNNFKPLFVRRLASRLARVIGPELVEQFTHRADVNRRGGPRLSRLAAAAIRLGIADELNLRGDAKGATMVASAALEDADCPELKAACLSYGALRPALLVVPDLATVPIAVDQDEHLHDAASVRMWVSVVRLVAADTPRSQQIMDAEWQRVTGQGWYRCWLRFVLALARVEADRLQGRDGDVRGAFAELARDVHPFRGRPRPCDLYAISRVIAESISRGLAFLRSEDDWRDALSALIAATEGTSSRLDREEGGPLPVGSVTDLLVPYIGDPVGGQLVRTAIEEQIMRSDVAGTYYGTHAEHAMRLSLVRNAVGDLEGKLAAWQRAGVFLAAYGWRKDITVFDVIEGAAVLAADSQDTALDALADAQPLANAVVVHTDGRSTKHAPNEWLRSVLMVVPTIGTALLARTISEDQEPVDWVNRRAIEDVAAALRDEADPALIDALLATQRFKVESQNDAKKDADARMAPILRLVNNDRRLAEQAIRRISAEVICDEGQYAESAAARVAIVAEELGLSMPAIPTGAMATQSERRPRAFTARERGAWARLHRIPPFASNPTFVDLLAGLRAAGSARRLDESWDDVIVPLAYHIGQLIDDGREPDAGRLLRFFARDVYVLSDNVHPLGDLAAALDNAGYATIAAAAYALAYTATRGGGGWRHMGDSRHAYLMERAVALDRDVAHQVVATEVAYALRGSSYRVGTSQHLLERLVAWGQVPIAVQAWRELYAVVRHRLPLAPDDGWFARLRDAAEPEWPDCTWSANEALIALLLSLVSEPRLAQKVNALAGVVRAIERNATAVARPLRWWLTRNAPVTSVALVLNVLVEAEPAPWIVTTALEQELRSYSGCSLFALRRLAVALLDRSSLHKTDSERVVCPECFAVDENAPEVHSREQLLSIDVGEVLIDLTSCWPELPDDVMRRLNKAAQAENYKERTLRRIHLSKGRDGDSCPPMPVLHWPQELLFSQLNEALCELPAWLWQSGQWKPEMEDEVLNRILPNIRLHLALAATRTTRPHWPAAEMVVGGLGDLPVCGEDDPPYQGWSRFALIERRYLLDPESPYRGPIEEETVFAGAVAVPIGSQPPEGAFPFRNGQVQDWWWPESPAPRFPPRLSLGPLVQLTRPRDWLGRPFVPIPPVEMLAYMQVRTPGFGEPLTWSDESGQPAIALRTWWLRNRYALSKEQAACEGVDLVIRPDFVDRMGQLAHAPLRELRVVRRDLIAED